VIGICLIPITDSSALFFSEGMQSIPDAPLLTTNIARAAQELETLKFFQLESLGYAKISKSIHQVQIVTPQKKTSLIAC